MEIREIYDWSGKNGVISLTPEYSKREVRNAGRILAEGDADAAEYARALKLQTTGGRLTPCRSRRFTCTSGTNTDNTLSHSASSGFLRLRQSWGAFQRWA